jgi:hypothetical protein
MERGIKRELADLPLERKLGVVVVPLLVALISVVGPTLISDGQDEEARGPPAPTEDASEIVYRRDVGDVCDRFSAAQRARRRDGLAMRTRLRRARTTVVQRNAIIDDSQTTIDRSTAIYVSFSGLTPPTAVRPLHEKTAAAWRDSLKRLRAYRSRLEDGDTRARLVAVVNGFKRSHGPIVEENAVVVREGMAELGGADCDIAAIRTVPVFALPSLRKPARPHDAPGTPNRASTRVAPQEPAPGATAPNVPTPKPTAAPTSAPRQPPNIPMPQPEGPGG